MTTRPSLQTDAGSPTAPTGSGRTEIYVERYPELGDRRPISTGGGRIPLWSRDGRELFFISLDAQQMFSVAVQTGMTLVPGARSCCSNSPMAAPEGGSRPVRRRSRRTVRGHSGRGRTSPAARRRTLILVQNWFEELKRLVPTN